MINNWPNEQDSLEIVCNYDHPGIKTYEALITRKVKVRSLKVPNFASIMNLLRSHALTKFFSIPLGLVIKYPCLFLIFFVKKIFLENNADHLLVVNGGYPGGDLCRAATISWE